MLIEPLEGVALGASKSERIVGVYTVRGGEVIGMQGRPTATRQYRRLGRGFPSCLNVHAHTGYWCKRLVSAPFWLGQAHGS